MSYINIVIYVPSNPDDTRDNDLDIYFRTFLLLVASMSHEHTLFATLLYKSTFSWFMNMMNYNNNLCYPNKFIYQ